MIIDGDECLNCRLLIASIGTRACAFCIIQQFPQK